MHLRNQAQLVPLSASPEEAPTFQETPISRLKKNPSKQERIFEEWGAGYSSRYSLPVD